MTKTAPTTKDTRDGKYHSWEGLLSRSGVLYIAEGDRGVGKSYPMLYRAMRRMVRHHRSCVWLRRTDAEVKDWLSAFGSSKWRRLAIQARIDPDKLRRQGSLILYNAGDEKRPEWQKLLRVGAVSQWAHFRDTDDPAEEIIYLDEAFATVEAHRRYVGNEVEHALDILKSLRRGAGSDLRMLIAGNAERAVNPWFDYFGITKPGISEGYAMLTPTAGKDFRDPIPYERIRKHGELDAVDRLVDGTGMGAFLAGDPKGANRSLLMEIPRGASWYANVDFGRRLSLWLADGFLVCSLRRAPGNVVKAKPDGCPETVPLTSALRKRFTTLRRAWQAGKIRFDSLEAVEWGFAALAKFV